MSPSKRHQRASKPPAQTRSRTTRSSKGRILSDPAKNNQLLTDQLRSLGLYAAPTLGDGNCLFRALSDQLYGTPSHHLRLRADICDWIETHKVRYEPFCEDERGLGAHLRCMREQGTYGGHLELSAFAHLSQRNVKVIQPGLVYVIEWAAGAPLPPAPPPAPLHLIADEDEGMNEREKRRLRRDQQRARGRGELQEVEEEEEEGGDPANGAVYVAYHDWEHFSSIRNLRGPHSGLPCVSETPADPSSIPSTSTSVPSIPSPTRASRPKLKLPARSSTTTTTTTGKSKTKPTASKHPPPPPNKQLISTASTTHPDLPMTPSQIPLPTSRSPSPISSTPLPDPIAVFRADISPPTPFLTHSPPLPPLLHPLPHPHPLPLPPTNTLTINLRVSRSPKRSYDESSGSSATSFESAAKRTRSSRLLASTTSTTTPTTATPLTGASKTRKKLRSSMMIIDDESAELESTPGLSAPGSSTGEESNSIASSSSAASSPLPTTPPPVGDTGAPTSAAEKEATEDATPSPQVQTKTLTRRQRKALGLPKPRSVLVAKQSAGAGKIVIPGGKYSGKKTRGRVGVRGAGDDDDNDEGVEVEVRVEEEEDGRAEWRMNGTGRVDVRGFRELKI